jgi:hypothetical protein
MVSDFENTHAMRLRAVLLGISWLLWQVIRWPLFALLVVLEPIACVGLSTFALLGTLCAFLFRFAVHRPDFPFWGMLGVSLACVGLLAFYYAGLRLLSAR